MASTSSCGPRRTACDLNDLNDLVDPALGWTLVEAQAINDVGQIVGYGRRSGGTHTYLLTPTAVPEPATWAMMILGIGMVGGALRRRTPRRLGHGMSRFAHSAIAVA